MGVALGSVYFGPGMVVAIIKCICRSIFMVYLLVLGLIILFEVEYRLAAISARCRIYECFVVFRFVYWTEFVV